MRFADFLFEEEWSWDDIEGLSPELRQWAQARANTANTTEENRIDRQVRYELQKKQQAEKLKSRENKTKKKLERQNQKKLIARDLILDWLDGDEYWEMAERYGRMKGDEPNADSMKSTISQLKRKLSNDIKKIGIDNLAKHLDITIDELTAFVNGRRPAGPKPWVHNMIIKLAKTGRYNIRDIAHAVNEEYHDRGITNRYGILRTVKPESVYSLLYKVGIRAKSLRD